MPNLLRKSDEGKLAVAFHTLVSPARFFFVQLKATKIPTVAMLTEIGASPFPVVSDRDVLEWEDGMLVSLGWFNHANTTGNFFTSTICNVFFFASRHSSLHTNIVDVSALRVTTSEYPLTTLQWHSAHRI